MAEQLSVSELLLRWQEGQKRGEVVSAEELCAACPELLDEVRQGIEALRSKEAPPDTRAGGQTPANGAGTRDWQAGPPTGANLFPWLAPSGSTDPDAPCKTVPSARAAPATLPAGGPSVPGYEVLGELGHGGMGVVYKARQIELNRLVALKMIRPDGHAGAAERARFRAEAGAVAHLRHPNIVQIYEVGEVAGRPFFSLEFVEGGSLDRQIKGTPLPAGRAAQLVEVLARTVHHAHGQGIVHRDLKPANVLLAPCDRPDAIRLGGDAREEVGWEPKVTDFGLAKQFHAGPGAHDSAGQTQSGAILGTPSYMAPEQAQGKIKEVGPLVDVYALGAILYELLTGRPPFKAATPLDTVAQVMNEEPARPARLNSTVPRDLETICLKCLQKEPRGRYASALDLAADLHRFRAGEPIRARPTRWPEHLLKWARRKPAAAALWGVGVIAVLAVTGAALWLAQARAEADRREVDLRRGVEAALDKAAGLQQQARWAEAGAILEQTQVRLGGTGPADLRRRLDQAQADLRLVRRLDAARLLATTLIDGQFDAAAAEREYLAAFREARLGRPGAAVQAVAARIKGSAIKPQLVAALDDWAYVTHDRGRMAWLLAVARRADPDPWRDRFRDPRVRQDRAALERLARQASVQHLSPQLLATLGAVLQQQGGNAISLLRAAQEHSPQDFWLNFELGLALADARKPEDAIGYYRVALALRPGTSAVQNNLGNALVARGEFDQAVPVFRQALRANPNLAVAHLNLGGALVKKGRLDDAIASFRKALRLNRSLAEAHYNLGTALHRRGDLDGAVASLREAIRLRKDYAGAWNNLGSVLLDRGDPAGAVASFRQAIQLKKDHAPAHYNLGNALAALGRLDEAIASYREAIHHQTDYALAHGALGLALQHRGRLDEAIAAYRESIRLNPTFALSHHNLGAVLADRGDLAGAISAYHQALRLDPNLAVSYLGLGQALRHQGQFAESLAAFRRGHALGSRSPRWPYPSGDLVRQAERWVELDARLPAVLRKEAEPASAAERLELARLCIDKQLYATSAQFYQDAFAAQPDLATNLQTHQRYYAACVAARAGCGQGRDASKLDARRRAHWRQQALDWLRADLTLLAKHLDAVTPAVRQQIELQLRYWQRNPELAGLREPAALDGLPDTERGKCIKLWADVEQLRKRAGAPK
jgi:serine/threonine-protein kinase